MAANTASGKKDVSGTYVALRGAQSLGTNLNKVSLATVQEVSPYVMPCMTAKAYLASGSEGGQSDFAMEWAKMQQAMRQDMEVHLQRQNLLVQGLIERYGAAAVHATVSQVLPKPPPPPPDAPEAVDLDEHVEKMKREGNFERPLREDESQSSSRPIGEQEPAEDSSYNDVSEDAQGSSYLDGGFHTPAVVNQPKDEHAKKAQLAKMNTQDMRNLLATGGSAASDRNDEANVTLSKLPGKESSVHAKLMMAEKNAEMLAKQDFSSRLVHKLLMALEWWTHLEEPKRTGYLARVLSSGSFEALSMIMVVTNCLFIVYTKNYGMQHIGEEAPQAHTIVEVFYAGFFLVELLMRMTLHRAYFFVNNDMGWNWMDFFIVALSTWNMTTLLVGEKVMQVSFLRSLRVLKLVRVLRLLRMVKMFTDLRIMVIAFLNSCLALMWCLVLLLYTLTIFSLVFVQFVEDYLEAGYVAGGLECNPDDFGLDAGVCLEDQLRNNFGSVQRAMLSLYMGTTGGNDWALYYDMLAQTGPITAVAWISYTALYFFGVFNLLTGMFVDKAVRASQPDADLMTVETRHNEREFVDALLQILEAFDVNNNGYMEMKEFVDVVTSDKGLKYLQGIGLEPKHTEVVYEELRKIDRRVPTMEFVKGCLRLRGQACNLDMTSLRYELHLLRKETSSMKKMMQEQASASQALMPAVMTRDVYSGDYSYSALPGQILGGGVPAASL